MVNTDGRRLRTERSRERVLDAVIELVEETGALPIAQQIADRAEMSIRSVFRLYDDINDLQSAAVQRRVAAMRGRYLAPNADLPLADRIDSIVTTWTEVHESITPLRRVIVGLLDSSEPLRDYYALGMTYLAHLVETTFAPELSSLGGDERKLCAASLDLALSWESWHRLRTTQGLGVDDARRVVATNLELVLGAGRS